MRRHLLHQGHRLNQGVQHIQAVLKVFSLIGLALILAGCESGSLSLPDVSLPSLSASQEDDAEGGQTLNAADAGVTLCELCLVDPNGQVYPASDGSLRGIIEQISSTPSGLVIEGWAADVVAGQPAQTVVAFIGTRRVGQVAPTLPRPTLARSFGMETLEKSGFRIVIPSSDVTTGQIQFRVFAIDAQGRYGSLSYPAQ